MANKPREVKDEPTDRTRAAKAGVAPAGDQSVEKAGEGDQGAGAGDEGEGDEGGAGEDEGEQAGEQAEPKRQVAYIAEASGSKSPMALAMLLDACERFGVNPEQDHRPMELLSWKFRPANPVEQIPASVTLVTAGGVKLVHYAEASYPMDPDTEDRLRNVFNCWRKDKDGTKVPTPLPEDLTLPEGAVTGLVATDDHVYRQGYLRAGGKAEAIRRGRR